MAHGSCLREDVVGLSTEVFVGNVQCCVGASLLRGRNLLRIVACHLRGRTDTTEMTGDHLALGQEDVFILPVTSHSPIFPIFWNGIADKLDRPATFDMGVYRALISNQILIDSDNLHGT